MKKLVIGLAVLVGLIAGLGLTAPKELKVERSVVINAPKAQVFEYIKFMKNNEKWSPWSKKDPQMVKGFTGTDGTVGAIATWSGNREVGVGEQEIKAIVDGVRIDYELRFSKPMKDVCPAFLSVEALSETQTKVVWGMVGHCKFPGNIFCMLMGMQKKVEKDFDSGLAALKTTFEK